MLSDNIRAYRKLNNMSQDELAEKLNISRQSVSLWENGATQPTVDNIIALANIFGISANDLLGAEGEPAVRTGAQQQDPKKLRRLSVWVTIDTVLLFLLLLFLFLFLRGTVGGKVIPGHAEEPPVSMEAQNEDTEADPSKNEPSEAAADSSAAFDLFTYCKDFAIRIGKVNGDYTIYQQTARAYGGNTGEFFSVSYWGDSDMVEFCLHCPFSDTIAENFYLRMRGGFDGKYEYASSSYYRSSGESICSAYGTIDPAVFSESYPLNCSYYYGNTSSQSSFMEESRLYLCALIKCLKRFTELEKMDCGFEAFGFAHF